MRFAFYGRVSTDDARNAALPRQLTTERARSPRVGGEIVTHCWPQALGAAWHRIGRRARVSVMREGGLSDLLATSANGRTFDTVIVESIDRLASAILTRTGHQPAPGAGGHEEAPAGPNPVQAPIVLMVVCCRRAQRRPRSLPAANRDRKDEMALRQTWRRSQIQAKLVPARRCAPTPRARSAGPDASTCFAAAYAARSAPADGGQLPAPRQPVPLPQRVPQAPPLRPRPAPPATRGAARSAARECHEHDTELPACASSSATSPCTATPRASTSPPTPSSR